MKRSALERRTPLTARTKLKAGSPLKSSSALKRTAFPSSTLRLQSPSPSFKTSTGLRTNPKPKPTVDDVLRWTIMREIGCIACLLNHAYGFSTAPISDGNPLEIQHNLSGGFRIGHSDTVCLCHFHHQAKRLPDPTLGYLVQAKMYGPSFGKELRRFRELYGTEAEQLSRQNELIDRLQRPEGASYSAAADSLSVS